MATAPSPPRCEGSFYGLSHRLVFDLSRATSPAVRWVRGAVLCEGGGGGSGDKGPLPPAMRRVVLWAIASISF